MKRLTRIFLLPYPEKKLLAQSFLLVLAVRIGLWILPFSFLSNWLQGASLDANKSADWKSINRIVRSVRSVSRLVPFATCLTQALATRVLLRMVGQASDLRIGVERDQNEKFQAHAWIEVDGRIVIGKVQHHHRFAVLNSN